MAAHETDGNEHGSEYGDTEVITRRRPLQRLITGELGIRLLIGILLLVLADQTTKVLAYRGGTEPWVEPIGNPATALGLIEGSPAVLIALMMTALVGFGPYLLAQLREGLSPWVVALIVAGSISNLLDRLLHGYVRDFIALPAVIVNSADLFLLVGTVGLLIFTARRRLSVDPHTPGSRHARRVGSRKALSELRVEGLAEQGQSEVAPLSASPAWLASETDRTIALPQVSERTLNDSDH